MAFRLAELWQPHGCYNEEKSIQFSKDIMKYEQNELPHSMEKDPMKYWAKFKGTVLGDFAVILMGLTSTSASIERLFSKLSRTKTKYRNRMLPENLEKMGALN